MSNKQRYILTIGLPGCGKTTWAKDYIKTHPNSTRVNRDDLREMLFNYKFSKDNEETVSVARNNIIVSELDKGKTVIVDETGLNPRNVEELRKLSTIPLEFQYFTDTDPLECISRDALRTRSVGSKVIWDMYFKYLHKPQKAPKWDPSLADVLVCDLDGTLAILGDRNPYDASKCHLVDTPNETVVDFLELADKDGCRIIFFSGRSEAYREQTEIFISNINFSFGNNYDLHMRDRNDSRQDSIIKREMYEKYILGKYNIRWIIDDRPQVVRLWISLGYTPFSLGYPGREF